MSRLLFIHLSFTPAIMIPNTCNHLDLNLAKTAKIKKAPTRFPAKPARFHCLVSIMNIPFHCGICFLFYSDRAPRLAKKIKKNRQEHQTTPLPGCSRAQVDLNFQPDLHIFSRLPPPDSKLMKNFILVTGSEASKILLLYRNNMMPGFAEYFIPFFPQCRAGTWSLERN